MSPDLWKLENVGLAGKDRPRLVGISAGIPRGRTAVLGPSGAGKSSLLGLLVEYERPDSGTLLGSIPTARDRPAVFWAPQSHGLWPHLNVRQHLESVTCRCLTDRGFTPDSLLSAWGLASRAAALPQHLSEGERARLAICRALAAAPFVLVLDEPLACIGEAAADQCWDLLRDCCTHLDTSVVFSTHLPAMALAEADHVLCLQEGRLLYAGCVDDLYQRPPSREAAACLGRTNWFEPEDALRWLGAPRDTPLSVRPESLALVPDPASKLSVATSRRRGLFTETEIAGANGQEQRQVFHRPDAPLEAGTKVRLQRLLLCLAILCAGLGWGCGKRETARLTPARVSHHLMPASGLMVPAPRGLDLMPDGRTAVVDTAGRILLFDRDFQVCAQWKMPESERGKPEDLTVLRNGTIAVPDTHYHRVVIFNETGQVLRMFGEYGRQPGQFIYPVSLAEADDGTLYVCEYGSNDRVQRFTPEGTFLLQFGGFGLAPGEFQRPSGIACLPERILVADAVNGRLQVFSPEGVLLEVLASESLGFPYDLALAADGTIWMPEWGGGSIVGLTAKGNLVGRFGTPGSGRLNLATPWGVAVRPSGELLIADSGNRRLVEVTWP